LPRLGWRGIGFSLQRFGIDEQSAFDQGLDLFVMLDDIAFAQQQTASIVIDVPRQWLAAYQVRHVDPPLIHVAFFLMGA